MFNWTLNSIFTAERWEEKWCRDANEHSRIMQCYQSEQMVFVPLFRFPMSFNTFLPRMLFRRESQLRERRNKLRLVHLKWLMLNPAASSVSIVFVQRFFERPSVAPHQSEYFMLNSQRRLSNSAVDTVAVRQSPLGYASRTFSPKNQFSYLKCFNYDQAGPSRTRTTRDWRLFTVHRITPDESSVKTAFQRLLLVNEVLYALNLFIAAFWGRYSAADSFDRKPFITVSLLIFVELVSWTNETRAFFGFSI